MSEPWKASQEIVELAQEIIKKDHLPRLQNVEIAIAISDGKPFTKNRLNWGSVKKFSPFNKLWQHQKYDFSLTICADVWESVLTVEQRPALLDLHLTRCEPVYEPEFIVENKKKVVVKDEFGRVKYTDVVKTDANGNPKWQIAPLDLIVFSKNVLRYGVWCQDLIEIEQAIKQA